MRLALNTLYTFRLAALAASCLLAGCGSDDASPSLSLSDSATLGAACETWSATLRERNEYQSGDCGSKLSFAGVDANRSYEFEIRGYVGGKICWATHCRATTQALSQCDAVESLCGN